MPIIQTLLTTVLSGHVSGVYVGSNSYLTFGSGSSAYASLSASNPPLPKIMIGAQDNSYQRVYIKEISPGGHPIYRVRYEGHSASSGGTPGSPTKVWEAVFYSTNPERIDIHMGVNPDAGLSGVFNESALMGSFDSGINNVSYSIVSQSSAVAIVTSITPDLIGNSTMSLIFDSDQDDGFRHISVPFPVLFGSTYY